MTIWKHIPKSAFLFLFLATAAAADKVILDWDLGKPLPEGWKIEGYAFGTRQPVKEERQKAAKATPNQQQYRSGKMTSPEFVVSSNYFLVDCGGTYHPRLCEIVLVVGDRDARSCSPVNSSNMRGAGTVRLAFDTKDLKGKKARIEVRDEHFNGWISRARITATDKKPGCRIISSVPGWEPDGFEREKIDGDFLLLPAGHARGTPVQEVTISIGGEKKLAADLPLAFGDMNIAGYLPVYDLTDCQGKSLQVSYHSFTGKQPAKFLVQGEIPGRKSGDGVPAFHPHCRIGRLNDPNGLCFADGVWHLFHQYACGMASKHWAHYTSTDLVNWKEKPIALFPDHLGSMHSGSGVIDVMNTSGWQKGENPPIIAAYTGSRGMGGSDKIQVQCIACSVDGGKTFTKYEGNPVVGKKQHLKSTPDHSRDPKVFWYSPTKGMDATAEDGFWVMILFEGRRGNMCHSIYTSADLKDWKKHGEVKGFYECPELFPLAVDGEKDKVKWIMYGADGNYHIGDFNGRSYCPETKKKIRMHYGTRFYAAQTFSNTPAGSDGLPRRVQVGWQDHQISFPVEMTLRNTPLGLRVCMLPVREIENLYTDSKKFDGLKLDYGDDNPLAEFTSGLYDIELVVDLGKSERLEFDIRGHKLVFDVEDSRLTYGKLKVKLPESQKLELRIVVDNLSTDIYAGLHGLYHMPFSVWNKSKGISVSTGGGAIVFETLRVRELKSIWKK